MSPQFILVLKTLVMLLRPLAAKTATTIDDMLVNLLDSLVNNPATAAAKIAMMQSVAAHVESFQPNQQPQQAPANSANPNFVAVPPPFPAEPTPTK